MKSHLISAFGIVAVVMVLFAVIAVVVVRNTSDLMVDEKLAEPDYMYKVTYELVENNASIVGSTVAFRSKYYPDRGHFFAPYLETGSRILVYTDGVTEAERADHGQYGESRLLEYAATCASGSVRDVTTGLLSSVDAFVAVAEQSDDITILAVGV